MDTTLAQILSRLFECEVALRQAQETIKNKDIELERCRAALSAPTDSAKTGG